MASSIARTSSATCSASAEGSPSRGPTRRRATGRQDSGSATAGTRPTSSRRHASLAWSDESICSTAQEAADTQGGEGEDRPQRSVEAEPAQLFGIALPVLGDLDPKIEVDRRPEQP